MYLELSKLVRDPHYFEEIKVYTENLSQITSLLMEIWRNKGTERRGLSLKPKTFVSPVGWADVGGPTSIKMIYDSNSLNY